MDDGTQESDVVHLFGCPRILAVSRQDMSRLLIGGFTEPLSSPVEWNSSSHLLETEVKAMFKMEIHNWRVTTFDSLQ
jgi:hypothetical protein